MIDYRYHSKSFAAGEFNRYKSSQNYTKYIFLPNKGLDLHRFLIVLVQSLGFYSLNARAIRILMGYNSMVLSDRYIIFHKPYGVLTQFTDADGGRPTLKNYIDVPDVYAVGRLDQDSEGLLLLTNNGRVQHKLSDPKFHHPKTYWVQVEGIPTVEAIAQLETGVIIQTYKTRPAKVKFLPENIDIPPRNPPIRFRASIPTTWLKITITEGKNRQVRRMTAAVGFPTLRLIRVAIAGLSMQGLEVGTWRDLTNQEITTCVNMVGK